jgi:phenylpropionate dioxygenase-like ring-hydroxylating dioxygenase large terminal subunit
MVSFFFFFFLKSISMVSGLQPFIFLKHAHYGRPLQERGTPSSINEEPMSVSPGNEKFPMHYYVVAESRQIRKDKLYKATIWDKNYVFWKDANNKFHAMDDDCNHRGASLSNGILDCNHVVCPYHGFEYDTHGILSKVPGFDHFQNRASQNQLSYTIFEKHGWVYINTIPTVFYEPQPNDFLVYEEPEALDPSFKAIFLNMDFNAYARIVSENSLDVMHIGFVHTFGNREKPSPESEIPPYKCDDYPNHYKTVYTYKSGKDSMAKKWFYKNDIVIENEFVLPHITVARILFQPFISTVITFATPINQTHTKLFVKTYRNFWNKQEEGVTFSAFFDDLIRYTGNIVSYNLMETTMKQDKKILENIRPEKMEGTFNMKYDKLQNVYRQLYKKEIHKER